MEATRIPVEETANGWELRHVLKPAAVLGLLALLYLDVVSDMARAWLNESGASHGILIPPLVGYVVWTHKREILAVPALPDSQGLWGISFGCVLYLLGRLSAEFFLTRVSLIVLLASLVWIFWGRARLRKLGFPLLLLITMIPIPHMLYMAVAGPLQLLASAVATALAQACGVSVFREGNIIHLAGASLGVEEACSGLHSISALLVGSLLVGFLYLHGNWRRAALVLSSFPIAIGTNVMRVTGTAVLADYRVEFAMGFYHSFSGWLVFLVAFGLLMLVNGALRMGDRGAA